MTTNPADPDPRPITDWSAADPAPVSTDVEPAPAPPADVAETEAIEAALAALPSGARTVEQKAGRIRDHLARDGWVLLRPGDGGNVHVLGDGEQIVTVPAGHTVEVVPTAPTISYADSELDTLAGIVTQLEHLAPDARERVAAYLTDRYGPVPAPSWPFASGPWLTTDEAKARVMTAARHSRPDVGGGHA